MKKRRKVSFLNKRIHETTWGEAIKGCTVITAVLTAICAAPFTGFVAYAEIKEHLKKKTKESETDET